MIHFWSLAGAVVDLVGVHFLGTEHTAGRNVNILLYVLLLVRNSAICRFVNLVQIPSTLCIFGFRGNQPLIQIGLHLLIPVQVLNDQIQIVLVLCCLYLLLDVFR